MLALPVTILRSTHPGKKHKQMSFIPESFGVCWPCALYVMLFFNCISGSPSSSIFFINADSQVGNNYECYHNVVSHPREKLLRGPDGLTAMGSFPLPPCTDVHQVLIPRSHTRTSNIFTHCTTRHTHTTNTNTNRHYCTKTWPCL